MQKPYKHITYDYFIFLFRCFIVILITLQNISCSYGGLICCLKKNRVRDDELGFPANSLKKSLVQPTSQHIEADNSSYDDPPNINIKHNLEFPQKDKPSYWDKVGKVALISSPAVFYGLGMIPVYNEELISGKIIWLAEQPNSVKFVLGFLIGTMFASESVLLKLYNEKGSSSHLWKISSILYSLVPIYYLWNTEKIIHKEFGDTGWDSAYTYAAIVSPLMFISKFMDIEAIGRMNSAIWYNLEKASNEEINALYAEVKTQENGLLEIDAQYIFPPPPTHNNSNKLALLTGILTSLTIPHYAQMLQETKLSFMRDGVILYTVASSCAAFYRLLN